MHKFEFVLMCGYLRYLCYQLYTHFTQKLSKFAQEVPRLAQAMASKGPEIGVLVVSVSSD
jgi:hypothetical protein